MQLPDKKMPCLSLRVAVETFPVAGAFTIARGSRTKAVVVTASITDGTCFGRGECVPYARYGETVKSVCASISAQEAWLRAGPLPGDLAHLMPSGAARNALDCALWDYSAKAAGVRAWNLAGIAAPRPVTTCYTLSLGSPDAMETAARAVARLPLLKVKLGGADDIERIAAVRRGAPDARLVVDANEAWTPDNLAANLEACARAGVEMVEQPLPAAQDSLLERISSPLPLCADESVHDRIGLGAISARYQAINIKLDKTGGLTEAFAMVAAAKTLRLVIMVGCMLGTSLAMAPAILIASEGRYVDLDGPLLLAVDRDPPLQYSGSLVFPPLARLWG